MEKTLNDEETTALAEFLSLIAAHLKTWGMGEWLSHDKAQLMASIAKEWQYRFADRDRYPSELQPWPPPHPSG